MSQFDKVPGRIARANLVLRGDSGRNILRGPKQFNIDFSLIKSTRVGRFNTEFRVEAFNLLNHPQFAQPNAGWE